MDRRVTPLTKGPPPPPLYKQSFKRQRRGRQRKRLTKNEHALFQIPSFLFHLVQLSNVGEFFWSWIRKDCT